MLNIDKIERPVHISICSEQYDLDGMGQELFFSDDGKPMMEIRHDRDKADGPAKIELETEGRMVLSDGRLELSYEETELTGMAGSTTSLSFDTSEPGLVTMLREGSVRTVLIFEEGKRHICAYETEYLPFELCIHSLKVENNMTGDGGRVTLDYVIEVKGAGSERTRFTLSARAL